MAYRIGRLIDHIGLRVADLDASPGSIAQV